MFPGDCELHRVGVLIARGAWSEGEAQARRACAHMEPIELTHVGLAFYEIGEVRLRLGDLVGAEEAFRRAVEMGFPAQPGLALLQSAKGETGEAAASLMGALAATWDRLARARILPALVELSLMCGDIETARSAAGELDEIAAVFPGPGMSAAAAHSRGALLLAEGRPAQAVEALRRSLVDWQSAGAPYDAARTRLQLAEALRHEGSARAALAELLAARSAFESLGASLDLDGVAELTRALEGEAPLV